MEIVFDGKGIIVTPASSVRSNIEIVLDPATRLPVLTAGAGMPIMRSDLVAEILAEVP